MTAPRSNASHDQNFIPTLIGVSTADGTTPVPVEVDPATGQMQVSSTGGGGGSYPINVISLLNSTTTNLSGGVAFTGTGEDVSSYAAIQVSVFSSHASATDGLSLQQSSDNINWDIADTYTIPATTGKVFSIQPAAKYFRLVYTNGATLTTSLRIQIVYHISAPNPSSQRAADGYTNETDLTQQWTFNSIFNGSTWDRLRGIGGAANVNSTAQAVGGYTPGKLVSAASTNATSVKGSAGTLGFLTASNVNAAARYLKFYNKASAPTVGTDVPIYTFIIPGNTAGAGTNIPIPSEGLNFSTGIALALTVEATDAGSTGVALSEIVVNYGIV